jgi:CRISPR-associated endonuclease Cas2
MLRRAEYKILLEQCKNQTLQRGISFGIEKQLEIDNLDKDSSSIGLERVWNFLHINFENPRAMNCFIFYDIQDSKIRLHVAKYLLKKGAQRIQKSVYLANISKKIYSEIFEILKELEEVLQENDSIFMVPIGEYHLEELKMIGKDMDMSFSRSNQHVIFI